MMSKDRKRERTMVTFEQELINAIEHGCPFCKSHDHFREMRHRREYVNTHVDSEGNTPYNLRRTITGTGGSQQAYVTCGNCGPGLFDRNNGWIPELADIVKGE